LQFEINGKEYFLAFVEDERRWFIFAPTAAGMEKLPVYVDAVKWDRGTGFEKGTHSARG
jgi:hypothetical protein